MAGSIGYIVGKKVGLPDGMSAVIHVTGDSGRDNAVAVTDGTARAVPSLDDPDVEITNLADTMQRSGSIRLITAGGGATIRS